MFLLEKEGKDLHICTEKNLLKRVVQMAVTVVVVVTYIWLATKGFGLYFT